MREDTSVPLPELDAGERPELHPLFRPDEPNHPCLFAALDGRGPGRVVVDREQAPTQALLHMDYGFAFATRDVSPEFLARAVAQLRSERTIVLVWDPTRDFTPPASHLTHTERREYRSRGSVVKPEPLPEGCVLRPMDASLLERCLWRGEVERAYGSCERYLEQAGGWCVVEDDAVLSEAYAFFEGEGVVELGVVTARGARGRGLAAHACAKVIETCESAGQRTYWSCVAANQPSNRVAEKLGFQDPRDYAFYTY